MGCIYLGSQFLSIREAKKDLLVQWKFLAPRHLIRRAETIATSGKVIGYPIRNTALFKVDAILLLGSNDPRPAYYAAALHHKIRPHNPDIKIVASGRGGCAGKGGHATVPSPLFKTTEAETYRQILISLGIPRDSVIVEPNSTNSGQNIQFSWERLQETGITPTRIAIVQSPGAQLRANLTFEKQWPSADWEYYISCPPPLFDVNSMTEEELGFHFIYALREAATLMYYTYHPDPALQFVVKRTIPRPIFDLVRGYYNRCSEESCWIEPDSVIENVTAIWLRFRKIFEETEARLGKS